MKPSIKKNFFYQAFYELLIVLLPLITSPYVSRVLGANNLGIHSFTYTIANYFVLFSALGIKNYGNREISKNRDDAEKLNTTFSGILYLHIFVSMSVLFIYCIYLQFFAEIEYKLYFYIQGLYVVSSVFDISWLYFGLENFKTTVSRNSVIKIVSALLIFITVKEPDDLWKYSLILSLSNFLGQAYLILYARKIVKLKKVDASEILCHLPQMLLLFIPAIAISVYNYMDKIMVGEMADKIQLGFYENSEKIVFVASSVIGSVGTVMLPRMSNITAKGDIINRNRYIDASINIVSCISVALGFGVAGISRVFSVVFWGNEYSSCTQLLILLSIVLPIKGFANVLRTQYLIPSNKDKQYTLSVCFGAIVNVVFNYCLIPDYRAVGAAIGTIFAELTVCIIQMIYCRKELPLIKYLTYLLRYSIIGLIMFGIVYFIGYYCKYSVITLFIQVFLGIIIYGLLMIAYALVFNDVLYKNYLEKIFRIIKK